SRKRPVVSGSHDHNADRQPAIAQVALLGRARQKARRVRSPAWHQKMSVEADRCLFIRLGRCGESTAQCIRAGEVRLYFPQVSHQFALGGRWTQVESQIAPTDQDREDGARHANQIRAFYEASASTLWITFHADCMWW